MAAQSPLLTFNDGHKMPQLGFGTWKIKREEVAEAVKWAIDAGYRHLDCAYCYTNEKEVGDGIRAKIEDGTVKREDLFITGKLWNTFHKRELAMEAVQLSLDDLGLDYLDMYMIHWPYGYKNGHERFPKDENDKMIYTDDCYVDAWKGLEDLVDAGKVKSIGLSNFNHLQIQEVYDAARIKPANLQVEMTPYFSQDKLREFCKEKRIVVTAHSPIGSKDRPRRGENDPLILDDPKVVAIAERLNKTPAQVVIRWHLQTGVAVIPKSATKERIESNFQVFDFSLSDEDMAELDSWDEDFHRGLTLHWVGDHPKYPFHIPY